MAEHAVTFSASAARELGRLDPPVARRVLAAIERLVANPRPRGSTKLRGSRNDWRIRIGDWRVIYTVDDANAGVDIAAIRHRSDAYR